MKSKLKNAFEREMQLAKEAYNKSNYSQSFHHLERAHILGQSYIIPHTRSHWWMLRLGWKTGDNKEIFGQVTRIIASIIFSRIWVPIGNTGGANVNPLKKMPIPQELQKLLDEIPDS
ncbi:DUF3703 domain-containing protein [Thalassomonas actiniarum]|uniref:DUF3703 domain-containing protein n=1 Tax=Thalassomonas actiniarum TaxID=485447 RepID=A0AAE9YWH7_9GAMM|nr:DUF3703 domain-containing protein [Thalassomonas actiniarum]WDE02455.1 DUF3703 domain-containing protein [Thalassomonas actiniarum]